MQKVKVIFPDGAVREMPAFIQRDLLVPHVNEPEPEDHRDWDFVKLKQPRDGVQWAAQPASYDEEKKHGNE